MDVAGDLRGPGRGRLRQLSHRLGLVALTATALAGMVSPASAGTGPGIELTVNAGSPIFISGAEIAREPQISGNYVYLGPAGAQTLGKTGVSVRQLLISAGQPPDHVSLLVVPRPRSGFGYLFGPDLSASPDFPDGPALVSVDGDTTKFFRPQRRPNDQNAPDDIATPGGLALAIAVYTGKLLTLAAHGPSHAAAKASVPFSATASCCALPGETLSYSWNFGDNQTASGASVAHSFAQSGSYTASVMLTGSKGSVSLPAQVTVTVGKPRPGQGPGSGGSGGRKSPHSGPSTGPSQGGGGHSGAGAGAGGANPGASAASGSPGPPASTTSPAPSRAAPGGAVAGLTPVNGILIADVSAPIPNQPAIQSAPNGAQASARAGNLPGPALPVGILAAVGIFAAGALQERRRVRPSSA